MTLQIGDTAPDFEAETTEGRIRFHDWLGDSWACCSRTRRISRPVCTTELGYMAQDQARVRPRNVKIIGAQRRSRSTTTPSGPRTSRRRRARPELSDDRRHRPQDLEALRHAAGEHDGDTCEGRTPADNQTVRNVFVIGPDKKIKLDPRLSDDHGPQLRRGPAGHRLAAAHREAQGRDAGELEAGRGRDHRRLGVRRGRQEDYPQGWKAPKPYIRIVPQPR